MNILRRSPTEHELPTREDDRANHHRRQTALRNGAIASGAVRLVVQKLVIHVRAAADHGTEEDAQERQSSNQLLPPADLAKDDGDGAQLHVQDAVAKAGVQGDEKADGRTEELHRAEQELVGELGEGDVPFLELGVEGPVAGFDAQAAGFVDEQARRVGFVDEDHAEDENEGL